MRSFVLFRRTDETGVSGTGVVAEGVKFSDGAVAMRWLTKLTSTAIYSDLATAREIHGHNGKTVLMYESPILKRAAADAAQDYFENCHFASIGGPNAAVLSDDERIAVMRAPEYIVEDDAEQYIAGYQWACVAMYGVDWRTRKGEVDGGVVSAAATDCAAPEGE